jgi:hypothetical protein
MIVPKITCCLCGREMPPPKGLFTTRGQIKGLCRKCRGNLMTNGKIKLRG